MNSIGKLVFNRILLILIRSSVLMNFKVHAKLKIVFSKSFNNQTDYMRIYMSFLLANINIRFLVELNNFFHRKISMKKINKVRYEMRVCNILNILPSRNFKSYG
jgi:hypothetical protein